MLVFLDERLVLLSTPKCASSSVQKAYIPYASSVIGGHPRLKHIDLSTYEHDFGYFSNVANEPLETVCVIRDPIAHLRSWYRYLHRNNMNKINSLYRGKSFEYFIRTFLADGDHWFFKTQLEFVNDATGKIGVNRIFALENIHQFRNFMNSRLGVCTRIPKLNVSKPVETPISSSLEAALRNRLSSDLILYEEVLQMKNGWVNPHRHIENNMINPQATNLSKIVTKDFVRRARALRSFWWT